MTRINIFRVLATAVVVTLIAAACGSAATPDSAVGIDAAQWATDVEVEVAGEDVHIVSNGVPDHEMPAQFAVPADPLNVSAEGAMVIDNPVTSQDYDYLIPLNPQYSETTTDTELGLIGLLISGAALYNPYEGGGTYALEANFEVDGAPFIDACNAHPQGDGIYHYHGVPYCITGTIDDVGSHSVILGVLLDGFPVYGPQDDGGDAPEDLDQCGGHFGSTPEFDGDTYHYHLSETASYSIECYHGVVDESLTGIGDLGPAQAPDLAGAAESLGISQAALEAALGSPPPDLGAAADALGISQAELQAALGAPG